MIIAQFMPTSHINLTTNILYQIRNKNFARFRTIKYKIGQNLKEQGSGIGLSLAQQIMRLHGGSISVQSVPEQETTFILTF